VADVETGVRRLIEPSLLGRHLHAVLGIVHQGVDPPRGHVRRGVEAQGRIVLLAPDDLFAPIAQQVCAERRCGLVELFEAQSIQVKSGVAPPYFVMLVWSSSSRASSASHQMTKLSELGRLPTLFPVVADISEPELLVHISPPSLPS